MAYPPTSVTCERGDLGFRTQNLPNDLHPLHDGHPERRDGSKHLPRVPIKTRAPHDCHPLRFPRVAQKQCHISERFPTFPRELIRGPLLDERARISVPEVPERFSRPERPRAADVVSSVYDVAPQHDEGSGRLPRRFTALRAPQRVFVL